MFALFDDSLHMHPLLVERVYARHDEYWHYNDDNTLPNNESHFQAFAL